MAITVPCDLTSWYLSNFTFHSSHSLCMSHPGIFAFPWADTYFCLMTFVFVISTARNFFFFQYQHGSFNLFLFCKCCFITKDFPDHPSKIEPWRWLPVKDTHISQQEKTHHTMGVQMKKHQGWQETKEKSRGTVVSLERNRWNRLNRIRTG